MKNKKHLFLVVLLGVFLLGFITVPSKNIITEARKTKEENILDSSSTTNAYLVDIVFDIRKTDEEGDFLPGVHFKLNSYNNVFQYNSELEGGLYYFDRNEGTTLNKMKQVLSPAQKELIDSIETIEDLLDVNDGTNVNCGSSLAPATQSVEVLRPCILALPTVFYLEETEAPEGYVKEKVLIPGTIQFAYRVNNPTSENPNVTLLGMRLSNGCVNQAMEYGEAAIEDLVGISLSRSIARWQDSLEDSTDLTPIKKSGVVYTGCNQALEITNHKGTVLLEAESFINNTKSVIANPDARLNNRVHVKNIGTADAVDSVIRVELPEGFIFVDGSASNKGEYKNGVIEFRIDRLKVGKELDLKFQTVIPKDSKPGQSYEIKTTISNFAMPSVVNANSNVKTSPENPKTGVPIGLIFVVAFIACGVILLLTGYYQKQQNQQQN